VAAITRACNNWAIDEWVGAYPGSVPPARHLRIHARRGLDGRQDAPDWGEGCHAVSCHPDGYRLGALDYDGDERDPAWRAAAVVGTVMVFHLGGFQLYAPGAVRRDSPCDAVPDNDLRVRAALSPTFRELPGLKMALAEGGIGWVPHFLKEADLRGRPSPAVTGQDSGDKAPSQVSGEHVQVLHQRRDRTPEPGVHRPGHAHVGGRPSAFATRPGRSQRRSSCGPSRPPS